MLFSLNNLEITEKAVPLHCVFHSIRFKVNKGWSTAVLLFFCPYVKYSHYSPFYADCLPIFCPLFEYYWESG